MLNTILRKEKAPVCSGAKYKTSINSQYKPFPPFGKKIMLQRKSGRVPARVVMVVFDWKVGRAYPRIIITEEANTETLEFGYLSGIPVQIVYCTKDADRVDAVAQAILKVNPSFLSTFNLDLVDVGKATTIIKPLKNTLRLVTP